MYCSNCGKAVAQDMNFCPQCGRELAAGPADETAAARAKRQLSKTAATTATSSGDAEDELLWEGSFSAKAMAPHWAAAAALSVLLPIVGGLLDFPHRGAVVFLLIVVGWLVPAGLLVYRRLGVRYVLTRRRLFHELGILLRTTNRVELIDVDDVTVKRSLLGRMLNTGTILLTSSDKSHPTIELLGIDDPLDVAERIDQACLSERQRRSVYIEQV